MIKEIDRYLLFQNKINLTKYKADYLYQNLKSGVDFKPSLNKEKLIDFFSRFLNCLATNNIKEIENSLEPRFCRDCTDYLKVVKSLKKR